jgi:hypothetical protein
MAYTLLRHNVRSGGDWRCNLVDFRGVLRGPFLEGQDLPRSMEDQPDFCYPVEHAHSYNRRDSEPFPDRHWRKAIRCHIIA